MSRTAQIRPSWIGLPSTKFAPISKASLTQVRPFTIASITDCLFAGRRYASQSLFSLGHIIAIDDKTVQVAPLRKFNRRRCVLAHQKLDPLLTELGSDRA